MTPFLEFATYGVPQASRDDIVREFLPKLESVCDDIEFDLTLWSLAQRLTIDTEELVRKIGAGWLKRSGLLGEVLETVSEGTAAESLVALFSSFPLAGDVPIPGMEDFSIEVTSVTEDRVKVSCNGARRCCSFIEGMARALCSEYGISLRYLRQPKKATHVLITFNCLT